MTHQLLVPSNPSTERTHLGMPERPILGQMAAVARALTGARGWTVDWHLSYEGDVIILATYGADGQTFVLSRTGPGLGLARMEEDSMVSCGTFMRAEATLDALERAVRQGAGLDRGLSLSTT